MGRGNVCVTGKYEGLFYVDNEFFQTYTHFDGEENCSLLLRDLSAEELLDWEYDEVGSQFELDYIKDTFIENMVKRFKSFCAPDKEYWINNTRKVILENKLFCIAIEDNEWSVAFELLQKEDEYGMGWITSLQRKNYINYLNGMKDSLFECAPELGVYTGPWTSGIITKN